MPAYYNEIDPNAAAWLRELIARNLIAPGIVDERSIEEIKADELKEFTQCHFFAGIGVWSHALRGAGWSDDARVWTGSCPCQSFSQCGKRTGFDDKRHLWPAWFRLIGECRPDVIFGEQVASPDGLAWFDVVSSDLEDAGYAVGAADLCAAGLGAPHIRQRLYFVADSIVDRLEGFEQRRSEAWATGQCCESGELGDPEEVGRRGRQDNGDYRRRECSSRQSGATNGYWRDADWIYCRDQKYRPVEPGTFPLATGAPARVGRLRGYGNAITAPVAQAFIESFMEIKHL